MSTPRRAASVRTMATGELRWVSVPPLSNRTASKRIGPPRDGGGVDAGRSRLVACPVDRGAGTGRSSVVAGADAEVVEYERAHHEDGQDRVPPDVDGGGLVRAQ